MAIASGEFLQQGSGRFHIRGIEAFGEPAVDRSQKLTGIAAFALRTPKARQARCRA